MFGIRPVWWILINSLISFVYLFIIAKILGKKQIAQLEFIDYVVGISLGSIAADLSTNSNEPFYYYLISMSVFFLLALFTAFIGRKHTFLKRIIKGKPSTLIYDGKINYKELKKNNIDVNDLLSMLRDKNYFDISDVAYAVFETSGKLSVLPVGKQKPVVISDVDESKAERSALMNVLVVDGIISYSGLREIGKSVDWLQAQLNCDLQEVILATYDEDNKSVKTYLK